MTRIYVGVMFLILWSVLAGESATFQRRAQVGEPRVAAVEAMLTAAFPGATPVWDTNLYVQTSDGVRTRIALSSIVEMQSGSTTEFIAGLQDYDAADRDLSNLRKGKLPADDKSRETVVAVIRNSSGTFQPVASLVLEPGHLFRIITRLVNPFNSSTVVMQYRTTDLFQGQMVEISWDVLLDNNLQVLRKLPSGIEVSAVGQPNGNSRVLYVEKTPNGIAIVDHQAQHTTQLPCAEICEPTIQQLLGS